MRNKKANDTKEQNKSFLFRMFEKIIGFFFEMVFEFIAIVIFVFIFIIIIDFFN
ncbi:hypothetical protein CBLAS_1762 [Campylobacter blaseri]|uniref:hypothetical protein n=1 Tax=Campylobacter blaseri TaxID=2042961 RepID=UPI001300064D|nr:hypothetical protein [Campylobacter blaseri]QKF86912.1 hypothetical protein CBLAS_1762 [Campylobacter blaseri]